MGYAVAAHGCDQAGEVGGLHGSGRMGGEEGSSMGSSTWMEATCLASVRHPNITAVYDFGEEGGEPYLVMEYVQGRRWPSEWRGGHCGWRIFEFGAAGLERDGGCAPVRADSPGFKA